MISRMHLVYAASLFGLAFLAGCGGGDSGNSAAAPPVAPRPHPQTAETGKTVGVALASMNHNFFIGMRQGVEEELAAQGLKSEIVVADDNPTNQQQQVDQLIQKGVDAIIMVPVDATQAVNPVKAANAAKIPVFCIDRRVTDASATVTATIETDNVAMGKLAAEHGLDLLCKRYKLDSSNPADVKKLKTTVVHLWGLEAASSAQDRAKGFEQVFNAERTPGVKLIKAVGDFNAKKSQEIVAPLLTANPEIELIFCHNDDNAIGALNAVKDVKKGREKPDDPKRILIVGMDGNKAAIEAIRAGEIEATVSQEPIEMGSETVKQVKKVLDGGTPDKQYIPIRHHLVTREDAEELQGKLWSDLLKGGI
jgi:ribose transport system substrate-binding protein